MKKSLSSILKSLRSFLNKHILATVLTVASILFALPFALHRKYNLTLPFDEELFGNYGDFIGGLLSVVSIYLLVETLKEQRATSKEQRDFTEKQQAFIEKQQKNADEQQINTLFFHLLKHLQREVADLNITTENGQYTNKDFFEELRKELQRNFTPTIRYKENILTAGKHYFELYAKNPRLGSYFRLLYRLCEIIHQSELSDSEKVKYIKILRAQLTYSELLLLRYNSQNQHGKKFTEYINEYNLLKHLPIFELLEFKDWWGSMIEDEAGRLRVSIFFEDLKSILKKLLMGDKQNREDSTMEFSHGGWKCSIILLHNSNDKVEVAINEAYKDKNHPFSKFDPEKLQQLLQCIIAEIFCHSNFEEKLQKSDITINKNTISSDRRIAVTISIKRPTDKHRKERLHPNRSLHHCFLRLSELQKAKS